jgi:hypothetical protein
MSFKILESFTLFYNKRVFPKIQNLRGATRLRNILTEKVSDMVAEEEIEPVKDLEWDNLIILDACRYVIYSRLVDMDDIDFRYTAGSNSSSYFSRNFSSGNWSDTVYVSGNPFSHPSNFEDLTGSHPEDVFHTIFYVFENKWDEDIGTVMPDEMVSRSIVAEKLFPEKKKIIHLMQPHSPYLAGDFDEYGWAPPGVRGEGSKFLINKYDISVVKKKEAYKKILNMFSGK